MTYYKTMKLNTLTLFFIIYSILFFANVYNLYPEDIIYQKDKTRANKFHNDLKLSKLSYVDLYDSISDKGQYFFPEMKRVPLKYWSCSQVVGISTRNSIEQSDIIKGLQYHLLCQSIAGLTNLAVEEGRSDVAVWLYDHSNNKSYKECERALNDMGITKLDNKNGIELASECFVVTNNKNIKLKSLFNGYILTDIKNNPESAIVAATASHVFNSIIVDIRDKEYFESIGYSMTYDARNKSTYDAWNEFKDKCNNSALIIMPTQTGELREFAIKNRLFVLNINKDQNNLQKGNNMVLLYEVLQWLKPNAPVLGWEPNVGEYNLVNPISQSAHTMIPSDWSYNNSLTSILYKKRQQSKLAKIIKPTEIDYSKKKNFVSFFLSDGDNVQWVMQNFFSKYYTIPEASEVKITFGLPVSTLSMMAPEWLYTLLESQNENTSIMEMLGGGYYYVDTYSQNTNRQKNIKIVAERLSNHMKQHRVKILAVMAKDIDSEEAKEAYKAYIEANNQLEGIIALQYSPYAAGEGNIFWFENSNGYEIPVITTKYSLWDRAHERENNPIFIANKLIENSKDESYSAICVHAWSSFNGKSGAAAAKECINKLDDRFEIVNMQELIWRIRMKYKPDQTKEILNKIY